MADASHATSLIQSAVVFLGAAALAVPAFRIVGLSGILGYLVAGIAIGPSGIGYFTDANTLFGIAEIGVVMFLFVIGLELRLSSLMAMRRDILWLGSMQMVPTTLALMAIGMAIGLRWNAAIAVGVALALSATAIALQTLQERGHMQHIYGKKSFAILIFQDMSIVPILALIPFLAFGPSTAVTGPKEAIVAAGKALAAIGAIVVAGRFLLNPLFRFLARLNSTEIMTVAALLVVLGAAALMSAVSMSMALGAFLAGLLLAESNFRHELEANIEPFRGLLLGLFFMSVGMLIDLPYVWQNLAYVVALTLGLILVKFAITCLIGMVEKAPASSYLRASSILTPAGEFSFVIVPLAASLGILSQGEQRIFMAVAAFSMLLGPLVSKAIDSYAAYRETHERVAGPRIDETFEGATGNALVIGFGRFGQQVNQMLLTAGIDVTIIDNDIEMIESAGNFGFKVFYGDGTRLDVLRAAGADRAQIICICIDKPDQAVLSTELIKANFPLALVHVRAYDRRHAIELMALQPDYVLRETIESALLFGRQTLEAVGIDPDTADTILADVRQRDEKRLAMQFAKADLKAGSDLTHKQAVKESVTPQPLEVPRTKARALNAETQELLDQVKKRQKAE